MECLSSMIPAAALLLPLASATVGGLCHSAERPIRWAAGSPGWQPLILHDVDE